MSATDTAENTDTSDEAVPGPKRLRPQQIAILLGVGIALITVVSGIAASTTSPWSSERCSAASRRP